MSNQPNRLDESNHFKLWSIFSYASRLLDESVEMQPSELVELETAVNETLTKLMEFKTRILIAKNNNLKNA